MGAALKTPVTEPHICSAFTIAAAAQLLETHKVNGHTADPDKMAKILRPFHEK